MNGKYGLAFFIALLVAVSFTAMSCGSGVQPSPAMGVPPASNSAGFTLTSDAGIDGGTMQADYTADGSGSSPALYWSNAPEGTVEFALMMTTIPVDGATKWNWVLYGIPANETGLAENTSGVGIGGASSHGNAMGYQPPASQGPGPKVYTFTVYALSASPELPGPADQVTGDVLTRAIAPITLGSASLSLSYTRPDTATGNGR
jgi:phosphatidylethanolamine-binding protein (PEBP) family uncharacterized protein